jgi:hypothetical protein
MRLSRLVIVAIFCGRHEFPFSQEQRHALRTHSSSAQRQLAFATASDRLSLDVHPLAVNGGAASGTLTAADRADYYAVRVGSWDNLVLQLDAQAAGGVNEVYVSYQTVPTRMQYDHKFAPGISDVQAIAPGVLAGGTLYALVFGDQLAADGAYQINAQLFLENAS